MAEPEILLLQARNADDPMSAHDHAFFVDWCGLKADHVVPHDLWAGPPVFPLVHSCDAVMVGGSGDHYMSKAKLPHFEGILDLLRDMVETGIPMFASCFGYQSLVQAFGARSSSIRPPPSSAHSSSS
jgi:hypothetical protein